MSSVVRGYGRASTDHQVQSTEQQEAVEREAFDLFSKCRPGWLDATWGGFWRDDDTQRCSKFRERHAGSMLLAASQPGDVILVANYDRIFANVVDVCETLELMRERKVKLLILDCDIDTTTDFGESVFKLLAVIKEMEVKETRRRTRAMADHRRKKGLPTSNPPLGWKSIAVKEAGRIRHYLMPDHVQRRYAQFILSYFEKWGIKRVQAYQRCNALGYTHPSGRKWQLNSYCKWLKAAQANFPLPNGSHEASPIPPDAEPVTIESIAQPN